MKRSPKPVTTLAKIHASLDAEHRREYPDFDTDAAKFGTRVADFNAGFIRAMKLVSRGPKNRRFWDNREKRLAAKALRPRKKK